MVLLWDGRSARKLRGSKGEVLVLKEITGGALMIRSALKRSARRRLSRVAMQNIRIRKQKRSRRCSLQGIKSAKAWSAGDSVLKEGWIKLRTEQLRLKLQSVRNH
jgi:hypothetical protein